MDELYQYYPGDEYVDWFAYSQFAQGRCQAMIDLARKQVASRFLLRNLTPGVSGKGSCSFRVTPFQSGTGQSCLEYLVQGTVQYGGESGIAGR